MFYLNNFEWKFDLPFSELGDYFRRVIRKGSITVMVVGKRGSGKSETTASICMEIDPSFCQENMVWDMDSMYSKVENLMKKDKSYIVVQADDFGTEADAYEFITESSKNLNYWLEKYRTQHIGLFITVPHPRLINKNIRDRLSDYEITVKGHNSETGFAQVMIKKKTIQLDKDFAIKTHLFTYLDGRVRGNHKAGMVKIRSWDVPRPPKSFTDWYVPFRKELGNREFKKSKDKHDLRQSQSKAGTRQQLEEDAKMVMAKEEKFIKVFRGERLLNVDLAKAEFGFGDKYCRMLNAYIRDKYLKD